MSLTDPEQFFSFSVCEHPSRIPGHCASQPGNQISFRQYISSISSLVFHDMGGLLSSLDWHVVQDFSVDHSGTIENPEELGFCTGFPNMALDKMRFVRTAGKLRVIVRFMMRRGV